MKAPHSPYAPSSPWAGAQGPCWDGEEWQENGWPQGSHYCLSPQPRPGFSHRPGTRRVLGTKAWATELSWRPGHLEGQTSCLRVDAARESKCDEKMWGLVVQPRELRAQAVKGQQENWALWYLRKTKGCKDIQVTCSVCRAGASLLNEVC